jgi:acetate---CoA ligase (ADP-forming)
LKEIFEPESIAVVGASPNKDRPGYTLVNSMLMHRFKGKIFPINPKYPEILGLKCFPSIAQIPDRVDLVFFAVAGSAILNMLNDCANKKVRGIVIISTGFSETSDAGARLESEISAKCKELRMRLLGPNTTGFVSMSEGTSRGNIVANINHFDNWLDGDLAIGGQTGIFAGAYMDEVMSWKNQRLGYHLSVSLGNKADLDEVDFIKYAGSLHQVRAIQLYLESLKRPKEFFRFAQELQRQNKPIIFLRGGITDMGRQSTRAHTGSPGQSQEFDEGYMISKGVIPVVDFEEFFDIGKGFSYQPTPNGKRVGVVTMSGSNGTLAADAASDFGLEFPDFSSTTFSSLKKLVPSDQVLRNPADIGFAMTMGKEVRFNSMQAVVSDPNVDALLVIDLPVSNSDYPEVRETYSNLDTKGKPVFVVLQGGKTKEKWLEELEGLKIPIYPTPRRALRVIQAMHSFSASRKVSHSFKPI